MLHWQEGCFVAIHEIIPKIIPKIIPRVDSKGVQNVYGISFGDSVGVGFP